MLFRSEIEKVNPDYKVIERLIHYPRKFRQPRRPTNESLLDGAELGFGDFYFLYERFEGVFGVGEQGSLL